MDMFIVVCTDFHTAKGPYLDLRDAVQDALKLNKLGGCTFYPVPLVFRGQLLSSEEYEQTTATKKNSTRGYL